MALPYLLVKNISEQGTYLRKNTNHFANLNIEIIQARVERIDSEQQSLTLNNNASLHYDKLLIATGSHPVTPPIAGMDLPNIFPCWTLDNARQIAEHAQTGSRVILMGAGFIGCIILEALAKSGADLTVIEMEDRMVPRMMNEKAGNLIKQWCLDKNIKVLTSTKVNAICKGTESELTIELDNGDKLPANMVVSATGVKANISFLEGSGIKTDQGIIIDRHMQSNIDNIYAAGDVAQGLDFSTGEYSIQAIQPTASEHGQIAARNMAGLSDALHGGNINMNVLDTLGLISSSFGLWMGVESGDSAENYIPERYRYLNLQFQDDILVGATSIGLTQHVGVLRGLIQSKIKLGKWKQRLIENPNRIMEAYLANTQVL
jgi:NAD(P)H-nitrite reductase large subunit